MDTEITQEVTKLIEQLRVPSGVLWGVFLIILLLFFLISVVLYHHWNAYIPHSKRMLLAKRLYMRVSIVLLGVMGMTLVLYSL
jgi:hypothetical protein